MRSFPTFMNHYVYRITKVVDHDCENNGALDSVYEIGDQFLEPLYDVGYVVDKFRSDHYVQLFNFFRTFYNMPFYEGIGLTDEEINQSQKTVDRVCSAMETYKNDFLTDRSSVKNCFLVGLLIYCEMGIESGVFIDAEMDKKLYVYPRYSNEPPVIPTVPTTTYTAAITEISLANHRTFHRVNVFPRSPPGNFMTIYLDQFEVPPSAKTIDDMIYINATPEIRHRLINAQNLETCRKITFGAEQTLLTKILTQDDIAAMNKSKFKGMFIAPLALRKNKRLLKPIVRLLVYPYWEKKWKRDLNLYLASGYTITDTPVILAFGVYGPENKENWVLFLKKLKNVFTFGIETDPTFSMVSFYITPVIEAINIVFPGCHHFPDFGIWSYIIPTLVGDEDTKQNILYYLNLLNEKSNRRTAVYIYREMMPYVLELERENPDMNHIWAVLKSLEILSPDFSNIPHEEVFNANDVNWLENLNGPPNMIRTLMEIYNLCLHHMKIGLKAMFPKKISNIYESTPQFRKLTCSRMEMYEIAEMFRKFGFQNGGIESFPLD
ncbi:uncharacterized protein SAPINGB_P001423 [Magnusiomyces paraingens]|uniref:Uncharacterized protein n=1 Tax=Magnusiomyces paraingens TaxID=2606893 RepID=A0A5E8B664_9ASCO|nr:uncharacterized protein SAPINGB_P001423 [Saprochaete ingens]VVT46859.1 unnamed protein product [Saprochaete ingens]